MRWSLGSAAALTAAMFVVCAFWPGNHAVPGPAQVIARVRAKAANTQPGKPASRPVASSHHESAKPASVLSSDTDGRTPVEQRISEALNQTVDFTIDPEPLKDAIDFIAQRYQVPILLDVKTLEDASIDTSAEVRMPVSGIKLRNMLQLLLDQMPQPMTYVMEDEIMKITTVEKANELVSVVVYDCRDLVNVRSLEIDESERLKPEHMDGVRAAAKSSVGPVGGRPKHVHANHKSKKLEVEPAQNAKAEPTAKSAPSENIETKSPSFMRSIPLIRVIVSVTGQANWADDEADPQHTIVEFGGLLVVRQTQAVQGKIREVLADIRRMKKEGAFASFDGDHAPSTRPAMPTTSP